MAQTKILPFPHIADFESARRTLDRFTPYFAGPDMAFARRVFASLPEIYRARLSAIGFEGLGHVLDAGCGFGQWTALLAELNGHVEACDVSTERLLVAEEICRNLELKNCGFRHGSLGKLPYEDGQFDGLFCYGVIHATPWKESIRECVRVLKPGGRLYLTANGLGWYLHCWKNQPHTQDGYDPRISAGQALVNTVVYERTGKIDAIGIGMVIDRDEIMSYMRHNGLDIVGSGPDGSINPNLIDGAPSFFKDDYEGHPGVDEILGVKRQAEI